MTEFLNSPQCQQYKAGFLALFQRLVNQNGEDDNLAPKRLQKTKNPPLYEFIKGQARIFCFRDGNKWVLTHGVLKKTNSTPLANFERAAKIYQEDKDQKVTTDPKETT